MTGSNMAWYRYWLEVRPRLAAVAVFALWIGTSTAEWGKPGRALEDMLGTPLAQSIELGSLSVWTAFANQMGFYAWAVALCLMGTGLRTPFVRNHASFNYTLTLPISRSRLISVQQAGNCVAALAGAALTLAAQCATLWLRGVAVPFLPLAISMAFATLFVIAWVAFLSALCAAMHEFWTIFVAIPLFIASVRWNWVTVTALPAYGEFPWISVAALLAITVLALAFMLTLSREQEFG
jgi:hypothetical protein